MLWICNGKKYNADTSYQAAKKAYRDNKHAIKLALINMSTDEIFIHSTKYLDYTKKNHRR